MDPAEIAVAVLVVAGGGVVRGYTGFGSSMIWVPGMSLVLEPAAVVPVAFVLEIAASAHLLPKVWRDVDWRSLRWLLLGTIAATPAGLYFLATVPAAPVRATIALVVLAATILLWRGFALKAIPGPRATVATGLVCGLLNGGTGIAGPPAILFYFSSPAGVAVSRASLIAFFLATDAFAIGAAAIHGLVTTRVLVLVAVLVVPMLLGLGFGHRRFIRADPERFRRAVLVVLAALSLAVLTRAALG